MRHTPFICIAALSILAASCQDDDYLAPATSHLVVEGWIDHDGYPVVMLTRTLPLSSQFADVSDLSEYMVRWARVVVSSGTDTVVLTGKTDKRYYPPFIYTTSRLRGRAGHTYTLDVEADGYKAHAVTTIPSPAILDTLLLERGSVNDTLWTLTAQVPWNESRFFQFFLAVGAREKQFHPAFLGNFTSASLKTYTSVPIAVNRGITYAITPDRHNPYFLSGDTIQLKFAAMDSVSYSFWDSYSKMLSLSRNPVFPYDSNLPSNVQGALGYWCGYGSSLYTIVVP